MVIVWVRRGGSGHQIKIYDLLSRTFTRFNGVWAHPPCFLEFLAGEPFSFGSHFPTSLPGSSGQDRSVCLMAGHLRPREIIPMCRGCSRREQGGGRRERFPASSPVGKRQQQEGPEGGADVCRKRIYLGQGSRVQGQLGNYKGWEKPGDTGDKKQLSTRKGKREGVAGD